MPYKRPQPLAQQLFTAGSLLVYCYSHAYTWPAQRGLLYTIVLHGQYGSCHTVIVTGKARSALTCTYHHSGVYSTTTVLHAHVTVYAGPARSFSTMAI